MQKKHSDRGYLLTLLTVVYAFNFLDRNVLGLLMQDIKVDLHLSDTQMGLLTGIAFALFYSTLGIPIARWADRGNRITIIALTTGVWSVMVTCCGMATSYLQLLIARIGVAVGEAGCVPPAQSLISDYYARAERPKAMSYYMLGGPLSLIVGYAAGGWINEWYGWRVAFFAIGLPGIALALLVRVTLREPRLGGQSLDVGMQEAASATNYLTVLGILWRQLAYRHLVLGFTVLYLFSYGLAPWTPVFLMRTYHMGTGELGMWLALVQSTAAGVGTYLGGAWASRYASRNEPRQLRVMAAILGAIVPTYILIFLSPSFHLAFFLMTIGAVFYCGMFGPLYAMIQELVPAHLRALSVAVVLLFSNLIGMGLGPIVVGMTSDLLQPSHGEESLRIALLLWTPGFFWAVFHLLRAAKYVQDDIAASARTSLARSTSSGEPLTEEDR